MGGSGGYTPGQQNTAADTMAGLGGTAVQNMNQEQQAAFAAANRLTPFYGSRMDKGLPFLPALTDYSGGSLSRAYAPQYGGVYRATSQLGTNTPSGYRDALINNLRAQQAGQFDQSQTQAMLMNEQAKQQGAAGVMGEQQIAQGGALGYGGLGAGVNQAILGGPLRPSPLGTIGGLAMGAAKTAALA